MWVTHWVSGCQLAPLHQAVEGGFQDHVFGWDLLLLHPFCRQLLEELREAEGNKAGGVFFARASRVFSAGKDEEQPLAAHPPACWVPAGRRGGLERVRGAEGPPLGIPSQEP